MHCLNVTKDNNRTNGLIVISERGASVSAPYPSLILTDNALVTASSRYTIVTRGALTHTGKIKAIPAFIFQDVCS